MKIEFKVLEKGACTLLTGRNGPDIITFELTEAEARVIHGEYYDNWRGAHIDIKTTAGNGKAALERLGITGYELIDAKEESKGWNNRPGVSYDDFLG